MASYNTCRCCYNGNLSNINVYNPMFVVVYNVGSNCANDDFVNSFHRNILRMVNTVVKLIWNYIF